MKVLDKRLIISGVFLLSASLCQAQFLKKVGKTIKTVAAAAISEDDKTAQTSNSPERKTTTVSKAGNQPVFDYAKYNIDVKKLNTVSKVKGEYLIMEYSPIAVNEDGFVATTVVGVLTEQERLSELGEGSKADVAYIFENGVQKTETTIGKLDKFLSVESARYDWYKPTEMNSMQNKGPVSISNDGRSTFININGKKLGPFIIVQQMIVDKSGKKLFATVIEIDKDLENARVQLIDENGKKQDIDFGGTLMAAVDFNTGAMLLPLAAKWSAAMITEKDDDKRDAVSEKMKDAAIRHPNEGDVLFFDGRRLENILLENGFLEVSGKNFFAIKTDKSDSFEAGLYLNGKRISGDKPAVGKAWANATGTNWAYLANELNPDTEKYQQYLKFKDGTRVPHTSHVRFIEHAGKGYVVWYTYQKGELSMCSREL